MLILDEATSNLDQNTESLVHRAIESTMGAKTIIVIAHHMSITRKCDTLFLLEDDEIAAKGTYDLLMPSDDRFRSLAAPGDLARPDPAALSVGAAIVGPKHQSRHRVRRYGPSSAESGNTLSDPGRDDFGSL